MDYKYIEQLLGRYWKCETSLEEEEILRAFFSQKDVPAELLPYKDLFSYQTNDLKNNCLGDDFDQKVLSMIEEPKIVKARVVTMRQRFVPLFKAAAVVAIFLSLGNAAQHAFDENSDIPQVTNAKASKGASVAMNDSTTIDSMQQSSIEPMSSKGTMIK
nr:pyruvate ferredoxin oxidoreductase [Prevotella sp.]